ncbi:hypothetical protein INR77_07605 [Erythrobacter sp. SCSIO 43205]|uniref:hypothetical protein n=1 Tax=Erythrobacter sp. SCSIO 43205 TaxID=2779361 RepID=UPI001CA914C7|nr:hypothetical protein [Erythrobacter sp. SCSIO 43205]UAB79513.1 hypothetical protein INR77_07605 [Erythrobacter sp. SCSIO 43205]
MAEHLKHQLEQGKARIVEAPVDANAAAQIDRSFNLPNELYLGTIAGYLGFIGVMAVTFMNPVLIIPMVIFAGFIIAGFGVPAIFTRLKGNDSKPMTWGQFEARGIMTNTGKCAPRDAAVQVLILPVLLVCWGIAAATIAAIVS